MSKKIMLRNVRLSYEHIFTASKFDDTQERAKYSGTFIVPKDHPDLIDLKRALVEAGREKFPAAFTGTAWPRGYTCALKDADTETDKEGVLLCDKNPEYKGCYVIKADSTSRPVALDRRKAAVTEEDDIIYSGCYVNVSLNAAGFEFGKMTKGVKCYLNGVQFVRDGERFGGDATADFDALDGEDDDFMA